MKRLKRFFNNFFIKHVAAWPEQLSPDIYQRPAADVNAVRSSVSRFFKYNEEGLTYRIKYAPEYDHAIDELRDDGWQVFLEVESSGQLCYKTYCVMSHT